MDYQVAVVGAGAVGLAVAGSLAQRGVPSVLIIEKERGFGQGISSRNSEVIHSGIYYDRGTLKARLCARGRELTYDFCRTNDVWHSRCGKLIVAQEEEREPLEELRKRGETNGVPDVEEVDSATLRMMEPEISAAAALFVGCTGIVSIHELLAACERIASAAGHDTVYQSRLVGVEAKGGLYELTVNGPGGENYRVTTEWVVNAAGLESDRVAALLWGTDDPARPVLRFCRGNYFKLSPSWRHRVHHLVYPLPDAEHGSLGIHLSFDSSGNLKAGPDAEWLAGREEDYSVHPDKRLQFFESVRRYLPALEADDLSPDFAGIRPRAFLGNRPLEDFYIRHEADRGWRGWINLIGIESPGLTAALAIGEMVASWIAEG